MFTIKLNPRLYPHYRPAPEPPRFPLADACPPRLGMAPPVLRKGVIAMRRLPHKSVAAFSSPCGAEKRPAGAVSTASVPAAPRKPGTAQQKGKSCSIWSQANARYSGRACHGVKLKALELLHYRAAATKPSPAAAPSPRPYANYRAAPFPLADARPPLVPLASPHGRYNFSFPVRQPAAQAIREGVLRLPHKFVAAFSSLCGAEKRPAGVAAARLPTASVPAAPRKPGTAQQKGKSRVIWGQSKAPAVPRARLSAWRRMKLKPSDQASTVMLRNIPTKIRSGDLIKLLDEHCSRVNRAAGAVIASYDMLYLPMHFRKEVNFGYALINFTSSAAANELYYSLQNCGWNEHYGSKKAMKIYRAKQQGKAKLLQLLKKLKLKCDNDKFLPVKLSPPRDGVSVPSTPKCIRCRSRSRSRNIKECVSSKAIGVDQATQPVQGPFGSKESHGNFGGNDSRGKEGRDSVWNKGTFPTVPEERKLYAHKT